MNTKTIGENKKRAYPKGIIDFLMEQTLTYLAPKNFFSFEKTPFSLFSSC
jgi:hypothetical protein